MHESWSARSTRSTTPARGSTSSSSSSATTPRLSGARSSAPAAALRCDRRPARGADDQAARAQRGARCARGVFRGLRRRRPARRHQLRQAAARFAAAPDIDACRRALRSDNPKDFWLSECSRSNMPCCSIHQSGPRRARPADRARRQFEPLRVPPLKFAVGWDEWNVTEDADLGLRLARLGLKGRNPRFRHLGGGALRAAASGFGSGCAGRRAGCKP